MIRLLQLLALIYCFNLPAAHADSKKGFPSVDSQDFIHFINTEDVANQPFVFIYSSLSTHKSSKEETSYLLTSKEIPHLSPVSRTSIFPDTSTQTRSEYFDFTIWGHLGNYFNQSAEIVELENKVVEIFKIIDSVNKKYKALAPNALSLTFNKKYTITADRNNYFSIPLPRVPQRSTDTSESRPAIQPGAKAEKKEKMAARKRELLEFRGLNPSQIRLNKTTLIRHSENLKELPLMPEENVQEELLISSTRTLRQVDAGSETIVEKIIYLLTKTPGYIMNNPLESFIYIVFIYLFFKVLTMIFLRR